MAEVLDLLGSHVFQHIGRSHPVCESCFSCLNHPEMKKTAFIWKSLTACHTHLKSLGVAPADGFFPDTPDNFFHCYRDPPTKIQHNIMWTIEAARWDKVHKDSDKVTQARLKSMVSPVDETFELSDADYIFQTKMDLGISPVSNLPRNCACGVAMADDSYNAMHWRDCIKTRSRSVRFCHDKLKLALAMFAREALIPTHLEPFHLQDQYRQRPDLEMMF